MVASLATATMLYALSRGVPMAALVDATGVTLDKLTLPGVWLPEGVVPRIWRLLSERFPGEPVALDMARQAPPDLLGEIVSATMHAADLRTILQLLVRNRGLLADQLHMELIEHTESAELRFSHPTDALDGGYGSELAMGVAARSLQDGFGGAPLLQGVAFRHEPLAEVSHYTAFFDVPVHFGRRMSALVFHPSALSRSNPRADPELGRFIQRHLDRLIAHRDARTESDDMARLRAAVAHNATRGDFTTQGLARRMAMSARSLQRLLSAHATTASALLQETRTAHARQLLRDPRLSIDEVAVLLGFSSERSFRRAFQRATGQTPAEVRRDK